MKDIEFFDVPGYNGKYEISKCGKVRYKGKTEFLKQSMGNRGYHCVVLTRSTKDRGRQLLHRLIALTFIPNLENKRTVNHKNGIKTDNRIENLEWATDQENINHAFETALNDAGENHYQAKIKYTDIPVILDLLAQGKKQWEVAEMYGVHQSQISDLKTKKSFKRPQVHNIHEKTH